MSRRVLAMRVGESSHIMFECTGCACHHSVAVNLDNPATPGKRQWRWNGSYTEPTFFPSIKVTSYEMSAEGYRMIEEHIPLPPGVDRYPGRDTCCHSFVEGGNIRFLGDCTHALAGKTVPLPEMDPQAI